MSAIGLLVVLAVATALLALCVRYLYLEPMHGAVPTHYPYALSFERSGDIDSHTNSDIRSDDKTTSIRFSAQARPEAHYVPIDLNTLQSARMLAGHDPVNCATRTYTLSWTSGPPPTSVPKQLWPRGAWLSGDCPYSAAATAVFSRSGT